MTRYLMNADVIPHGCTGTPRPEAVTRVGEGVARHRRYPQAYMRYPVEYQHKGIAGDRAAWRRADLMASIFTRVLVHLCVARKEGHHRVAGLAESCE